MQQNIALTAERRWTVKRMVFDGISFVLGIITGVLIVFAVSFIVFKLME